MAWIENAISNEHFAVTASSRKFLHGTSKQNSGEAIAAYGGLIPGSESTGRGLTDPVGGKVYLTQDLKTAVIYALGAYMMGHELPKSFKTRDGQYGYVFEVEVSQDADMQPDEDLVGELISENRAPGWLMRMFNFQVAPSRRKRVMDGEWDYFASVGKQLLKRMEPWQKKEIMGLVKNVAHQGEVKVLRGWKIDKDKSALLDGDGSNFFEYAEEISIKNR